MTVFGNRRSQHSKALISPLKNLLFENNEIISETEALKIIIETDIIVPADERGGGFGACHEHAPLPAPCSLAPRPPLAARPCPR